MSTLGFILVLAAFALASGGGAYIGCIYGAQAVTGVLDRTIKETMNDTGNTGRAWAGPRST